MAASADAAGIRHVPADVGARPHALPLHSAPSQTDVLALKRQRVKSEQNIPAQGGLDIEQDEHMLHRLPAGNQHLTGVDMSSLTELPGLCDPLLLGLLGEPMSGYFQRLKAAVGPSPWHVAPSMELDGVYIHKRPIRGPNGASPLAVCGSVLHHVLVFVKQGSLLHSLDFGPANGADVTANVLEEAPAKRVLATTLSEPDAAAVGTCGPRTCGEGGVQGPGAEAVNANGAPAAGSGFADMEQQLPYLYLGASSRGVDDPLVQQLISFAESRPYHALRNNCIHFADALVRVLTIGAVRGGPLLYDLHCGAVPPVDNPMLLMLQLMLRLSWFSVVDGSPLMAAFLEHLRARELQQTPVVGSLESAGAAAMALTSPQDVDLASSPGRETAVVVEVAAAGAPAAAASDGEDTDNNVAAASATEADAGAEAKAGPEAAAGHTATSGAEVSASVVEACSQPDGDRKSITEEDLASRGPAHHIREGLASADPGVSSSYLTQPEGGEEMIKPLQQEEECRQEQENDHAICDKDT